MLLYRLFANFAMNRLIGLLYLAFAFASCSSGRYLLDSRFSDSPVPPAPDYSNQKYWAALPAKKDLADSVPGKKLRNGEADAVADVFFIHPTIYTYKPTTVYQWNGDVNDSLLNKKTDESTILYQASVFNGSCRIYAPRYRQAQISAFYNAKSNDGRQALDVAYEDVKAAFEYYLENYNHGRPLIIASHSQGTRHAERLLKDFFTADSLKNRLVAAYLVGMPVNPDSLPFLPPCSTPDQTGCYCTWNTFASNFYPSYYKNGLINAICTNPLSWRTDTAYVAADQNLGGVLRNFKKEYPHLCDAQVHEGMLWINKPHFPGSRLTHIKIYHLADYNLFYLNIRKNVQDRIDAFRK